MFFTKSHDASVFARVERIRTGLRHVVTPCRKYLCPPKEYFGRDWISGFTVTLTPNAQIRGGTPPAESARTKKCVRCKKITDRFKQIGPGEYLGKDCWWTCKVKYS